MFGQWHVYSLEMTPGTHISSSLLFILDGQEFVTGVSANSNREIDHNYKQSKLKDNSQHGIDVNGVDDQRRDEPSCNSSSSTVDEDDVDSESSSSSTSTSMPPHGTDQRGNFGFRENELVQAEEKLVGVAADAAYSLLTLSSALSSVGNRISADQWKRKQLKIYQLSYPDYPA